MRLCFLVCIASAVLSMGAASSLDEFYDLFLKSDREKQIIDGYRAMPGQFPYQAYIEVNLGDGRISYCGGSLLTRRIVLTARHCVTQSPSATRVVLGEHRRSSVEGNEQVRGVRTIVRHGSVDAAILRLSRAVRLNSFVRTISMRKRLPRVGRLVTTSGWGRTLHSTPGSGADYLQYVTLPRQSNRVCSSEVTVRSHELCIGRPTGIYRGVCHGDSGGPLVHPAWPNSPPRLIGITERIARAGCPSPYHYGVFVSVPYIRRWALRNIRRLG